MKFQRCSSLLVLGCCRCSSVVAFEAIYEPMLTSFWSLISFAVQLYIIMQCNTKGSTQKICPYIEKKNTVMRNSMSAAERLTVTLRFLATGEYNAMQYKGQHPPLLPKMPFCLLYLPPKLVCIHKKFLHRVYTNLN
jgi:hypothetical protein